MASTMKAIVYTKYGSPEVLRLEEVEKPTPEADEVLIRIHAAALTAGDVIVVKGKPFITRLLTGLTKPENTIPGKEMAGRVEAIGENVTQFKPGDGFWETSVLATSRREFYLSFHLLTLDAHSEKGAYDMSVKSIFRYFPKHSRKARLFFHK